MSDLCNLEKLARTVQQLLAETLMGSVKGRDVVIFSRKIIMIEL